MSDNGWGTPNQAKLLVLMLVILGLAIVWAIHMNNIGPRF